MKEKLAPLVTMRTKEVCARYNISRGKLIQLVNNRAFPSPIGKERNEKVWDVRALEEYDRKRLELSSKSWDPSLAFL